MKVSVIVPIYNAEKYLEECLDSIALQTYQDFEAILIDDGSTDGSGSVCDRYAAQDARFTVIHQVNYGLIHARKTGVMAAKGDYIAFVDADDWVDEDFLEVGIVQMEREAADIVIAGYIRESGFGQEIVRNRIFSGIYGKEELVREIYPYMLHYKGFYEFGILPYIWNKFYRRRLLALCYENIDTGIYDGEDVAVVYPYLLKARKVVINEDVKYHYRIHSGSMTANRKEDYYENVARLYLHLAAKFNESDAASFMMPQLDQYMRMMIWQGKPSEFVESVNFSFPFREVPKDAAIIIYGAGYVGRLFHHQVVLSGYCTVVAWVDRLYQREELKKLGVVGPSVFHTEHYDYVVLAVRDKGMASDIMRQLASYGVNKDKVIFAAGEV